MKKTFLSILVAATLLIPLNSVFSEDTGSSGYNAPVIINDLRYNASLNSNGQVNMIWDKYAPSGFNYYKIVRSTTNSNPVYPEDGYIKYTTDADYLSYTDQSPPKGTVYYRICSIASPNRYCSPVITINYSEASSAKSTDDIQEAMQLSSEYAQISMQATETNGKVKITWQVDGNIISGFKIVKSTVNQFPTYPVISGDSYKYLTENSIREYLDTDVKAGKTYYYRVCQYDTSGKCKSYSNSANVAVGFTAADPSTPTTTPTPNDVPAEESDFTTPVINSFDDTSNHQYKSAIEYLKAKGIVQGVPSTDGAFSYLPEKSINRAEFIKIVVEGAYGGEYKAASNYALGCFNDIPSGEWYENYVCFAKSRNIIEGYPDGTFGPNKSINFVEASKILVKVYNLPSSDESGEWYIRYVRTLQNKKYIPPTIDTLNEFITRGEMAELIFRIKEQINDKTSNSLLSSNINANPTDTNGWQTFYDDGYTFSYPSAWYKGIKRGWNYLSEEKDYIDNLETPNYMNVDTYVVAYKKSVGEEVSDDTALKIDNYFDHPQISSEKLTINGLSALKRHYRAPRGTVVNDRTTGENENIVQYTYRNGASVYVLQYFNAAGSESYGMDNFKKIAESMKKS